MALVENRRLAWIALILAMALSILLSGGGGLAAERAQARNVFYQDMNIHTDLLARAEAAYNLSSVCSRYDQIDQKFTRAVNEARQALVDAHSIPAQYAANVALTQATEDLYTEALDAQMSDQDAKFARGQYSELQSRNNTIGHSDYNQRAEAFNGQLAAFPAGLIGGLYGVRPLELFR